MHILLSVHVPQAELIEVICKSLKIISHRAMKCTCVGQKQLHQYVGIKMCQVIPQHRQSEQWQEDECQFTCQPYTNHINCAKHQTLATRTQ